jgi:hypothetical protein
LRETIDPKQAGVAGTRVISANEGGNLENAVSRAVNQPEKNRCLIQSSRHCQPPRPSLAGGIYPETTGETAPGARRPGQATTLRDALGNGMWPARSPSRFRED